MRAAPRQSFVTEYTIGVSLRREGTNARAGPRYEWVGALSVAPGLREERWVTYEPTARVEKTCVDRRVCGDVG